MGSFAASAHKTVPPPDMLKTSQKMSFWQADIFVSHQSDHILHKPAEMRGCFREGKKKQGRESPTVALIDM